MKLRGSHASRVSIVSLVFRCWRGRRSLCCFAFGILVSLGPGKSWTKSEWKTTRGTTSRVLLRDLNQLKRCVSEMLGSRPRRRGKCDGVLC